MEVKSNHYMRGPRDYDGTAKAEDFKTIEAPASRYSTMKSRRHELNNLLKSKAKEIQNNPAQYSPNFESPNINVRSKRQALKLAKNDQFISKGDHDYNSNKNAGFNLKSDIKENRYVTPIQPANIIVRKFC